MHFPGIAFGFSEILDRLFSPVPRIDEIRRVYHDLHLEAFGNEMTNPPPENFSHIFRRKVLSELLLSLGHRTDFARSCRLAW